MSRSQAGFYLAVRAPVGSLDLACSFSHPLSFRLAIPDSEGSL